MSNELAWEEAGCSRACRDGHTHKWGRCAYGVEPAPTLERAEVVPGPDGHPSLVYRSMDAGQVAEWLREQGYAVTVPMSDETTPGPACFGPEPMTAERRAEIREVLTGVGPSIPMGPNALFALHKDRDTNRRAATDLLAEVDRLNAEIEELTENVFATLQRERATVQRAEKADAERDEYREAFKSSHAQTWSLIRERDQFKAANDRAKTLATNATRTECGAGWDLNPAEVIAALGRSDLPAIRDLVASLDPRDQPAESKEA